MTGGKASYRIMHPFSTGLSICVVAIASHAQTPTTLAALRDHYRPLLVFEGGDAKRAQEQLALLAGHADAMRQRQVVVLGVKGSNDNLPSLTLTPQQWQEAQRRFRNKPDRFTIVLLGKDGGEKLRSNEPLTWQKLQDTIDAMPMRRDEVRSGTH